ncbi:ComEC/Rec2 family competence protein, partial [Streptomyces sp. W16]|uniref:ComEC/Rec2 family competence protein n=1 Tax=Streptomyces sp. W16 TaxID=3076631 RepID=UPI00295AD98B
MTRVHDDSREAETPRTTPQNDASSRRAVHVSSGNRRGAAHPHQEGPTDLRLVPPALAAWATAALALDASPVWVTGVAVVALVAGLVLLLMRRRGSAGGSRPLSELRTLPEPPPTPAHLSRASRPSHSSRASWPRASIAALLLSIAAAAASAGFHGADLRRGPVPELAREYAAVTAEVEVGSDPRLTRPRISGDHAAPVSVLIEAEVRRVEQTDGTVVETRAPVLLIVDPGSSAGSVRGVRGVGGAAGAVGGRARGSGGGPERSPWLGLLPSTRVRVTARLAPSLTSGDRVAAVLRVRNQPVPEVVGKPSGAQRFAGRLRAGLREATDGLPADARALLPGLVVGDTARITPELDEAFKETDLAHTLAVSGSNLTILLALLIGPPGLAQLVERRGLAPRLGISLRATALLGGVLTLGFVVVCRPDPSVLRAAACGAVALLALATGRRRSLIPALATAVLLLVLYDPWLARSYGFLLSVLATGALLTLAPRWCETLRRHRVPPRLAEALAAAAAA